MKNEEIEHAKAFRKFLAKLIRSGAAPRTVEYDALDAAISAAEATPPVSRSAWYHLDAARWAWEGDAR